MDKGYITIMINGKIVLNIMPMDLQGFINQLENKTISFEWQTLLNNSNKQNINTKINPN